MENFREKVELVVAAVAWGEVKNVSILSHPGHGTMSLIQRTILRQNVLMETVNIPATGPATIDVLVEALERHKQANKVKKSILILDLQDLALVDDRCPLLKVFSILREALETQPGIILYSPTETYMPAGIFNRTVNVSM